MSASSFITLFITDTYLVSAASAALVYAVFSASGAFTSPIGGYISDRLGAVRTLLLACLAVGPMVFLLPRMPYAAGTIVILLVWGFINSTRMPATESYIMSHASSKRRSAMFGIYFFSSQEGGGILAFLVGFLTSHFGYSFTFSIVGIAIVIVAVVCGVFIWSGRNRTPANITSL
jgi:predicted MFS family arabinose efflux permease